MEGRWILSGWDPLLCSFEGKAWSMVYDPTSFSQHVTHPPVWRQETVKGISHLLIWSPMTSRLSPLYSFSLSTHLTVERFSVSRWWSLMKESPLSRSPGDLAQLLAYSQLGLSPHPHPSLSSERNPRNLAACLWDLLSQEGFIFPYPSDSENWELEWIRIFFL